jgi:hypothetical protein
MRPGDRPLLGPNDDDDHLDRSAAVLAVLHHDDDDHLDGRAAAVSSRAMRLELERRHPRQDRRRMPDELPLPAARRRRRFRRLPAVGDALRGHYDHDDDKYDDNHLDDLDDQHDDMLPDELSDVHLSRHVVRIDRLPRLLGWPIG